MSFQIFFLTFHVYGLIIGLAIWIGIILAEKNAAKLHISRDEFWRIVVWAIIGGVIGARVWHVITDWPLYANNLFAAFQIWRGGLSILGVIAGGIIGLALYCWHAKPQTMAREFFLSLLDVAALSLPFSQAIGRLGNAVNQELYGLPSFLPWAIIIDPAHRLPGFEHIATYHPLFAYEMIGSVCIGVILWKIAKKPFPTPLLQSGSIFLIYVLLYSALRFSLDFLRLGKPVVIAGLGANQIMLLITFIVCAVVLIRRVQRVYVPQAKHIDSVRPHLRSVKSQSSAAKTRTSKRRKKTSP